MMLREVVSITTSACEDRLGPDWQLGWFDLHLLLNFTSKLTSVVCVVLFRVSHPETGIVMSVVTDQPGVQFYTGNFLNVSKEAGKNYHSYPKHSGFCLETQNFPDAPNHVSIIDTE